MKPDKNEHVILSNHNEKYSFWIVHQMVWDKYHQAMIKILNFNDSNKSISPIYELPNIKNCKVAWKKQSHFVHGKDGWRARTRMYRLNRECIYKQSVISSFDPPKMEKRWRCYHTYFRLLWTPWKLSWVRFRVPPPFFSLLIQQFLEGLSSKLIFSWGFLAINM